MGKYIILRDENKVIDGLLFVKNYNENFGQCFSDAVDKWMKTDCEFYDFVLEELGKRGYDFDVLEYEIIQD